MFSAMAAAANLQAGQARSGYPGLCLNEDASHFFYSRADQRVTRKDLDHWVDQYAGTQIRELMINPNAMRTNYASTVWTPIWHGYQPDASDDQPLFASLPPENRKGARGWVHTAWQLHQDGIDIYSHWIARARRHSLSPWLSMRMNDVHSVDDEQCFMHSEFWRAHPEYRRVQYRYKQSADRAFDYSRPEVYRYHFALVRELAERYDFDGLELDWMRFGFHFRPGHEREGCEVLTRFMSDTRALLDKCERRRGHRIKLGARVAARPEAATGLGMDAIIWAQRGLIDLLVVTPFWATVDTDIPVETWNRLLRGTSTELAAGLELLLRPYPDSSMRQYNSLETVRGVASSMLDRGADRIYLFNYMDSQTTIDSPADYRKLIREVGSLRTMAGKPRRHVMTYADTEPPGQPIQATLPVKCERGVWYECRLHTGPKPTSGDIEIRLGLDKVNRASVAECEVRLNGTLCNFEADRNLPKPAPESPVSVFRVSGSALHRGYNLIEVKAAAAGEITWVEIAAGL